MSSTQRLKPPAPTLDPQALVPAAPGPGNAAVQRKAALAGMSYEEQVQVLRPPSESSSVQRKAAGPAVQMDKNFDAVTKSGMKEADAPADITVPKEVKKGMQDSMDASLPGGKSQEQGGNVVRNKDGSYGWRQGQAGTSGYYTPDYGDVGADQELIGIGHTHPYSKAEGGHTDVSFSGGDLSSIVWESQPLNLMQSGQTLFVVARTAEFEKLVAGKDTAAKQKLADEIEKCWDDKFAAEGPKGMVAAAEAATKVTCAKYHLVYYKGKGETLSKVDTSK